MVSRRGLLQSGLALSAMASAAGALGPAQATACAPAPLTFGRFVFSNQFAESLRLARHAAERGAVLWETGGDMTALWCDHLKAAWDAHPTPMAGVTTRDGLFVLETLAADYRMRVVYRGEHGAPRDGRVTHRLTGSDAAIARVQPDAHLPWSASIARMMTQYVPGLSARAPVAFDSCSEDAGQRTVALYSWIIAAPGRTMIA